MITLNDLRGDGGGDGGGGAMRQAKNILLDVRMKTHQEALEFGRKKGVKVKVYKKKKEDAK